jgi:hypothetical protein
MNYLSVGNDAKTVKGQKKGVLTGILYLAPHTLGGGRSLCPFSTAGCRAVCLYTAGRGAFNNVQQARIRKTQEFLANSTAFCEKLAEDVRSLVKMAAARDMIPAVRLNGTTDIEWEKYGIIQQFPDVQFYDYTKWPPFKRFISVPKPDNYHITFSYSESPHSDSWASMWQRKKVNTAIVFNRSLPDEFVIGVTRRKVIDGDESDLRFTDPKGVIVGLKTKGFARKAEVGPGHFVQEGRVAA